MSRGRKVTFELTLDLMNLFSYVLYLICPGIEAKVFLWKSSALLVRYEEAYNLGFQNLVEICRVIFIHFYYLPQKRKTYPLLKFCIGNAKVDLYGGNFRYIDSTRGKLRTYPCREM